jgi:selenocysteine lyase/cysteine desulfurase
VRDALADVGWDPVELPEQNRSTIVSVPLDNRKPVPLLRALSEQGVICAERDGNLRLAVHFYNHEDDIERLVTAMASVNGRHDR